MTMRNLSDRAPPLMCTSNANKVHAGVCEMHLRSREPRIRSKSAENGPVGCRPMERGPVCALWAGMDDDDDDDDVSFMVMV